MAQLSHTEDPVQDAIEQAERACQSAVEETPESYRGFLTFIRQNKRVGGSRQHPLYAAIRLPYMRVDGRVKMALDEHREQGATLVIQTQFESDPASDQLLCRATVTSAMLGTVTAHARVFLNGPGVDSTNPMENAETSAVGRALGFLGYGLYGTGIASAEEVLLAVAEREAQSSSKAAPDAENSPQEVPANEIKPPSKRQLAFLRDLLEQSGRSEDDIEARLAEVETSQDASVLINQLRKQQPVA
ncbi:MAG: hypothetical protein ETSY1_13330 [Candidatus Entotheonella factor]|uniref:Uncharacterized protein n=1 Tax=Entotheonella factor TaxID=1429438 RepID=W4LQ63_ENTF1|nr:MAG: hypothetical protein ETSY1_13330 [Candidatus Entotheonella factor]